MPFLRRIKLALESVWLILWCGNLPDAEETARARTERIAELETERDVWKARFEECSQHWTNEIEEADRVERDLKERLTSAADALETERTRANAAERLAARAEEDLSTARRAMEHAQHTSRCETRKLLACEKDRDRLYSQLCKVHDVVSVLTLIEHFPEERCITSEPAGSLFKPLSAIVDTAAAAENDGLPTDQSEEVNALDNLVNSVVILRQDC